jgi:hypothetical protein
LAEVVDAVAGVQRPPSWWHGLYAGLGSVLDAIGDPAEADALAALRVPLVTGSAVTGPRGLLLPGAELPAEAVSVLGLRVVHPEAAHPLLERLGARSAAPASVLDDERVRAEVADSLDSGDPGAVAEAVLTLVHAAGISGERPWLAELALPGSSFSGTRNFSGTGNSGEADGWWPAGELIIAGSPLARVVDAETPFGILESEFGARWPGWVLAAAGVLSSFSTLDLPGVELDEISSGEDPALILDGGQDWAEAVRRVIDQPGPVTVERFRAVRDLEWVRPEAWPEVLSMLAREPLRSVLTAPCFVLSGGRRVEVPAYTSWWLSSQPVFAGRRPGEFRLSSAAELAGLYDEVPGEPDLAAEAGCWSSFEALLAACRTDSRIGAELLWRLGDPARTVSAVLLPSLYPRLAEALAGAEEEIEPPEFIRVAPDRVVPAGRAVVLDAVWLLDRLDGRDAIAGGIDPLAVAELLDIPLVSEL